MPTTRYDVAPLSGYPSEYGLLLATLQDSTREWRDELGDVDADLICWQPYPKSYSIGGILLHIAEVEAYWIEEFSLGRPISAEESALFMSDEIQQYSGSWPTPPHEPLSYYYDMLDRIRARTLESVRSFASAETEKESPFGTLTLRWVVAHVAGHDSYHGGQAVMLKEIGLRSRA